MQKLTTKQVEWSGYWLPDDMYKGASRAERMKHRRKMIRQVERKFGKIEAVMRDGTARDKHKLMEFWDKREQGMGKLRAARVTRQIAPGWESV